MKNNKGFTLVEMMVSISILSFIIVGLTVLLNSSTRGYSNMFRSTNLQYESQIVMSQIQERVIDCNGGIVWLDGSNTLLVVNKNPDNSKTVHGIRMVGTEMLYGTSTSSTDNDNAILNFSTANITSPMSQYLSGFEVVSPSVAGEITTIDIATEFEFDNRNYSARQTVALRNKPYYYDNITDLIDRLNEE